MKTIVQHRPQRRIFNRALPIRPQLQRPNVHRHPATQHARQTRPHCRRQLVVPALTRIPELDNLGARLAAIRAPARLQHPVWRPRRAQPAPVPAVEGAAAGHPRAAVDGPAGVLLLQCVGGG